MPHGRSPTMPALLRHAAFLRALAGHLLREPADADDAVQATWQASLERPPRHPSAARAWLAAVLRNKAREQRRRRARRTPRERRAARPERVGSAVEDVVREETVRRIAEAVLALDEPYRTAILLRYYEDLPPKRIAERLAVPVETVKSRLKRARATLRGALHEHRRGWQASLLPLAGGGAPHLAATMGATIVSTKVKTFLAVALVAILGAFGWAVLRDPASPGGTVPDEEATASALPGAEAQGGPALQTVGRPSPAGVGERDPDAAAAGGGRSTLVAGGPARAAPGEGALQGRIRVDGVGGLDGTVRVRGAGTERAAEVARDGAFRVTGLADGSYTVLVDLPGRQARSVPVQVLQGGSREIRVAFGSGSIHGVVYDEYGRTKAGAGVRLSTALVKGQDGYEPSAEGDVFFTQTTSDAAGRYEFRDLPAGTFFVVGELAAEEANRARDIRSFRVTLAVGEARELDLGTPIEDGRWVGSVHYAGGEPVRGAGNIFLAHGDGQRRMYVHFGPDGRFSEQVPHGTWRMEFVLPCADPAGGMPSFRVVPTAQELVVQAGEVREDAILPGARVSGHVEGHDGAGADRGVRQVLRFARLGPAEEGPPRLIPAVGGPDEAIVAVDGAYVLDGMRPGRYRVTAAPRALDREVEVEVAAGRDVVLLDVTLEPRR